MIKLKDLGSKFLIHKYGDEIVCYDSHKQYPSNRFSHPYLATLYWKKGKVIFNEVEYTDLEDLCKAIHGYLGELRYHPAYYDPDLRKGVAALYIILDHIKELGFMDDKIYWMPNSYSISIDPLFGSKVLRLLVHYNCIIEWPEVTFYSDNQRIPIKGKTIETIIKQIDSLIHVVAVVSFSTWCALSSKVPMDSISEIFKYSLDDGSFRDDIEPLTDLIIDKLESLLKQLKNTQDVGSTK